MKSKDKKTIVCLIGPTAVGKTEVALELAKKINAEIISCDSMQVYKGVDIATAKATKRQRKEIPHHLIDILSPSQRYNAARFKNSALKVIADIHKRERLPLIVAGTGFYLQALLDGLFSGPGRNMDLRRKFYQQAKRYGASYLYKRLRNKDPQSAKTIHSHDLLRIIRALEVYKLSGLPISALKRRTRGIRDKYALRAIGLIRPRGELYSRIEKRVDKMFKRGLVAEIKRLTKRKLSKSAKSLLGYKEIKGFLDGEYSCNEARALLKKNTRHYAKHQLSWFKRDKSIEWIEVGAKDAAQNIAKKILPFCL